MISKLPNMDSTESNDYQQYSAEQTLDSQVDPIEAARNLAREKKKALGKKQLMKPVITQNYQP